MGVTLVTLVTDGGECHVCHDCHNGWIQSAPIGSGNGARGRLDCWLGRITPAVGTTNFQSLSFAAVNFTKVSASWHSSKNWSTRSIWANTLLLRASSSAVSGMAASFSRSSRARSFRVAIAAWARRCISAAFSRVICGIPAKHPPGRAGCQITRRHLPCLARFDSKGSVSKKSNVKIKMT